MSVQELKAQIKKYTGQGQDLLNIKDSLKTEARHVTYERPDWKKIDIDFLSSYYVQDGNNAAVTGGIGTEYLTDFTQKINISFPTSPKLRWNVNAAYDYYSSASTDNIDNVRSSDSSSDIRSQLNVGLQYNQDNQHSYGLTLGTSMEWDYSSLLAAMNYSLSSLDANRRLDINAQVFYDTWHLVFPRELRGDVRLPTNKRQSYNLSFNYAQVINRKMQISLNAEATYMRGLLSTPFHRVYFQEQETASIEILPDNRLKLPFAIRANMYLSEKFILRTYYRYYMDSWGMQGHTVNIELPIKLTRFFAVYPHYRFHTQSAIDYFKPYKAHSINDVYYTSDFDLSELHSHTYGFGVLYGRADGLLKIKTPFKKGSYLVLDRIDLKYSHFDRSTGLSADIISLGLKLGF